MNNATILYMAIIVACLLIEGFFAGTEMSIISGNKLKYRYLARKGHRGAIKLQNLLKKPQLLLATTLVGVNLAIIISSAVASRMLSQWVPEHLVNIATTALMLPIILFFGEVVPMTISRTYATKISLVLIHPLLVAHYLLYPIIVSFSWISERITNMLRLNPTNKSPFITREELIFVLEDEIKRGGISKHDQGIVKKIFTFQELLVDQIMVPLEKVVAVEAQTPCKTVLAIMRDSGFSRLPVYEKEPSNIIGIVRPARLLRADLDFPISQYMFKLYAVRQLTPVRDILWNLQMNGRQMVVIQNKQRQAIGIVTLEDIMERVVGSIMDEYDASNPQNSSEERA